MLSYWRRPATVPLGRVWDRFQGKERDGKPRNMYQIRDVDEKWKDKCLDMTKAFCLYDEPLSKALGIPSDPASISAIGNFWNQNFSQYVSLACFTEEEGDPAQLVGVDILHVATINDKKLDLEMVEGEPSRKFLKIINAVLEMANVFQYYGVLKYLISFGLIVAPEHKEENIEARMYAARKQLCRALGIDVASSAFISKSSQVSAEQYGYQVLAELSMKELIQHEADLTACEMQSISVMGIWFNFEY